MISVFGWPDPNTGLNQSEHALYTCYFITSLRGVFSCMYIEIYIVVYRFKKGLFAVLRLATFSNY